MLRNPIQFESEGEVTEEDLIESAKNYAEYARITEEKMYLPNNFLENYIFKDFAWNLSKAGQGAGF